MVCCGYMICFTPYYILVIVSWIAHNYFDVGDWLNRLCAMLLYSNSIINPFIYAAKYREFQTGARRLLAKMKLIQQQ